MKTIYTTILLAFLFYSCEHNKEDKILKNFKNKDKYEYLPFDKLKKQLIKQ